MDNELNKRIILELSKKCNGVNVRSIKKKYFEYFDYLRDTCELRLRLIMDKYYCGRKLNETDEKAVGAYIFFSNPSLFSRNADGPSYFDLCLQAGSGSGNFSEEEIELLNNINDEIKQRTAGRRKK